MVIKLVARESPAHHVNCAPSPDDVIFQVGAMLTDRDVYRAADQREVRGRGGKKDGLGSARVIAVITEKNP